MAEPALQLTPEKFLTAFLTAFLAAFYAALLLPHFGDGLHGRSLVELGGDGVQRRGVARSANPGKITEDPQERIPTVRRQADFVEEDVIRVEELVQVGGRTSVLKDEQSQAGEGGRGHRGEGVFAQSRQIEDCEAKVGGAGLDVVREVAQVVDEWMKGCGAAPGFVAVVDDHGKDGGEVGSL